MTPATGPDSTIRLGNREATTVGEHHVEPSAISAVAEGRFQNGEIAADQGLRIGVDQGGRGALVLADFAGHLARQRDRKISPEHLVDDLLGLFLMRGIAIAVQEAYREGLQPFVLPAPEQRPQPFGIQRLVFRPVGEHAAVHAAAQPALDQRRHQRREMVERVVAHFARHLRHVLEAGVGQQADPSAPPLQYGIRNERGGMDDRTDLGEADRSFAQHHFGGAQRTDLRIVSRQRLRRPNGAGTVVDQRRVGKGAPDVYGKAVGQSGKRRSRPYCVLGALRLGRSAGDCLFRLGQPNLPLPNAE
jgi:hypothetical protein